MIKKVLLLFSLTLLVFAPLHLHAGYNKQNDIKGRVDISDFYSSDSGNYDFHILTTKFKIYKPENKKSDLYFNFNFRHRKRISNRDVHSQIPEYRFNEMWIGYKYLHQRLKFSIGRQFIRGMHGTYIDGLDVRYLIKDGLGFGVFGGLAPDKYDNSFNTDFRSVGVYSFLDRDRCRLRIGYENLSYKGETDREYFSMRLYSNITKKVRLNAISSASINQITNNIDIENVNLNLRYAYSKDLRFSLFYNYYRSIKYFESSKKFFDNIDPDDSYYLDYNSQSRIGVNLNYRITRRLRIYAYTAYQKRQIDDEEAIRFTGGFSGSNLLGFDLSGRYTFIDNFTSKSNEFNVNLSRNILNKIDASIYASHEKQELDLEGGYTSGVLTYGASIFWSISKNYHALIFLERYDEDDYYNTSLYSKVGYRF